MNQLEQSQKIIEIAYKALDDKKGEDIKILDIHDVSVIADYFVIASGNNPNQVQAMADSVEEELNKQDFVLVQKEGYHSAGWILLDFGSVVVHVFHKEVREFYCLERLWRDASTVSLNTLK